MFEVEYQPLSSEHPGWGMVALLPWDAQVFGFQVGDYRVGDVKQIAHSTKSFVNCFNEWATQKQVELVSCSLPAMDLQSVALLPQLGFAYIDYTLQISQPRFQSWKALVPPELPVRNAGPKDMAEIERIAQTTFRHGRYHADPRFPRDLAEARYKLWLRNAFETVGANSRLYVVGEPDQVLGFFHVDLEGDQAHITIIGIDETVKGTTTGVDLCIGALQDLQKLHIQKVSSKVSSANTGVMNFAVFFGWRFSDPQCLFHWHSPNAPHLVPFEQIYT